MTQRTKESLGQRELSPGVIIAVIGAIVVLIGAWFYFGGSGPSAKVDLQKVDLTDADPPRPGQPGYRERTTDPPR